MTLCGAMLAFMLLGVVSCNNEDSSDNSQTPFRPQNVKATVEDSRIFIQWSASWESSASWTVIGSSSYDLNINTKELHSTYTYVYDSQPYEGYNYYQVINNRTNEKSEIISVYYSSPNNGSGNDNGDNNSGDNGSDSGSDNGGDNGNGSGNGGNEGGSGNDNGGSEVLKPAAPTNVRADNYGSVSVPDVRIIWNASSGATSYTVYRSTSANGSYSQINKTSNTFASDNNVTLGKTYYYKVKASNSAGTSDYSDYAMFEYKDTRKPGPVTYGSCSVSGSTMTLRWSLPSTKDYGKPTKAILRAHEPTTDTWFDVQELPGTATSASFNMTIYIDSDGFVKAGIILQNDYGTGGGTPKVYDTKNKRWIN